MWSVGMVKTNSQFVALLSAAKAKKQTKDMQFFTASGIYQVATMLESLDLSIFVVTDRKQTDGQSQSLLITPCAWGNRLASLLTLGHTCARILAVVLCYHTSCYIHVKSKVS